MANWTAEQIRRIMQIDRETNAVSLNELVNARSDDSSDTTEVQDFIESPDPTPAQEALHADVAEIVRNAMNDCLTKKQFYVLSRRYGIGGTPPASLNEIGEEMHISRERVRQIEFKAKCRLKHYFSLKGFTKDIMVFDD